MYLPEFPKADHLMAESFFGSAELGSGNAERPLA